MWHHKAEITYNFADNKKDPDDDRRDFCYAKQLLKRHCMKSRLQEPVHRPCRCSFISKKQKAPKERVGHFLGVQLALTWRR